MTGGVMLLATWRLAGFKIAFLSLLRKSKAFSQFKKVLADAQFVLVNSCSGILCQIAFRSAICWPKCKLKENEQTSRCLNGLVPLISH